MCFSSIHYPHAAVLVIALIEHLICGYTVGTVHVHVCCLCRSFVEQLHAACVLSAARRPRCCSRLPFLQEDQTMERIRCQQHVVVGEEFTLFIYPHSCYLPLSSFLPYNRFSSLMLNLTQWTRKRPLCYRNMYIWSAQCAHFFVQLSVWLIVLA